MKINQVWKACGIVAVLILLLPAAGLSQDTANTEKVLFLESKILKTQQDKPIHRIFCINDRIKVRLRSNDTSLHGKIGSINDTSVVIHDKTVLLKDIKGIKLIRGKTLTELGAGITVLSAGLIAVGSATHYNENHEAYNHIVYAIVGIFSAMAGVPMLIVGIIDMLTVKYYDLDKEYILLVKTKTKKK
jgi:hypothetical protein